MLIKKIRSLYQTPMAKIYEDIFGFALPGIGGGGELGKGAFDALCPVQGLEAGSPLGGREGGGRVGRGGMLIFLESFIVFSASGCFGMVSTSEYENSLKRENRMLVS